MATKKKNTKSNAKSSKKVKPKVNEKTGKIYSKRVTVETASGEKVTFGQKFINFYNGLDLDGKIRYASKVVFNDTSSMLRRAFVIFIFYSFIGWIVENFVEIVINKWYYMPREFFRGPICPIFGIGALVLFAFFDKFLLDPKYKMWGKIVVIFVGSVIITSAIEYITSYILEAQTGTWPWKNYENQLFNLGGRIALFNSLGFGFISTVSILWIQPRLEYRLITMSFKHTFDIIFWVLFVVFVLDIYFACKNPTGVDLSKKRDSWAYVTNYVSSVWV